MFRLLKQFMGWVIDSTPFRWLKQTLYNIVSSLWFRVMGTFTAVLLIVLFSVNSVVNTIIQREFNQYIQERNAAILSALPSRMLPNINIKMPTFPDFRALPNKPGRRLPSPEAVEEMETVIEEIVESVIVEKVVVKPRSNWQDFYPENSTEGQGLNFLLDVQRRTQTAVSLAGLVALLLGTLLVRQITRPMVRLRLAAQAIAQGRTRVRVVVKSKDEMGKVAAAFNQMAAEIELQEQSRKQMVADVAHELRTPLTVMQSNLEAMLDGLLQPSPTELQELHDEVGRLARMTDDLRLLSLADARQLRLNWHKVEVHQLIETVIARLLPLAESRSVQLLADMGAAPLFIQADGDRLQQALGNLVDNGIRHAARVGGVVRVTAVSNKQSIAISITDNGSGIPSTDIPHLFERFWRGDKSRTRNSGGSGLGLSIVKQIIDLHDG